MNHIIKTKRPGGTACPTGTHSIKESPDPRLVFLHRAHARLILVENGLMSLDEAVSNLVVAVPCAYQEARHD
jgi:hypothetical protein